MEPIFLCGIRIDATVSTFFRVLAALGVMVAHFLAHLHQYAGVSLERVDRWNFVDFFFVLSGFVLA